MGAMGRTLLSLPSAWLVPVAVDVARLHQNAIMKNSMSVASHMVPITPSYVQRVRAAQALPMVFHSVLINSKRVSIAPRSMRLLSTHIFATVMMLRLVSHLLIQLVARNHTAHQPHSIMVSMPRTLTFAIQSSTRAPLLSFEVLMRGVMTW